MAATKPVKPASSVNFLSSDTPLTHAFDVVGEAEIVPPKWIIKGVIPTGLTVYISPPKNFKSTVLLHWVLRCLKKTSTVLPEHLSQPAVTGPVIMLSTETTAGTIKFDALFGLRVHVTAGDPLFCQTDPFAFRLDNEDNMKELIYWLRRIKPVMLVIDPLRNSHGVDENDAGEMVKLVQPLQQYAIKNDMACVIVHHTKKPSEKSKPDDNLRPEMARGTGALFGLADGLLSQIVLTSETEQPQLRIAGVFKRGPSFTEDVDLNVEWAQMKLDVEIAASVYNLVLDGRKTTAEICEKVDLREAEVLKYLNYMYKNKIIDKTLKHWEIEE
jgi:hypothetical protein